jgi:adenylyltransferase/sulfurtransferase
LINNGKEHLLVDVRPKIQYSICSLPDSLHIPIEELESKMDTVKEAMKQKNISDKDGKNIKLFLIISCY